jgi:hypothetical protein
LWKRHSNNCKAIGQKLHETIRSHVPLIPGIYVAPHYGITPWYYKYNMAMAIKWHKLKQQGQDRSGLPPLIKPPYIFQPTTFHAWCLFGVYKVQIKQDVNKCIYKKNVFMKQMYFVHRLCANDMCTFIVTHLVICSFVVLHWHIETLQVIVIMWIWNVQKHHGFLECVETSWWVTSFTFWVYI